MVLLGIYIIHYRMMVVLALITQFFRHFMLFVWINIYTCSYQIRLGINNFKGHRNIIIYKLYIIIFQSKIFNLFIITFYNIIFTQ